MENRRAFANKVKDRDSWKVVEYSKKDLDELTKLMQDPNIAYQ